MRSGFRKCLVGFVGAAMVLGTMGGFASATSTVAPQFAFSDTSKSPYSNAINFLASQGFISGDSGIGGTFRPSSNITRCEAVKIFDMVAGLGSAAASLNNLQPTFTDGASVPSWCWGFVNAAQAKGYVNGYPDGSFGPNNNITVVEVATVLLRINGLSPKITGPWPTGEIVAAAHYQITNDLQGTVNFNVAATREQVASMAYDSYVDSPTGQTSQATGVFTDNNPSPVSSQPANADYQTCTGTVSGTPTGDAGISLTTVSNCNLTNYSSANLTASAPFSATVWLNGATQFAQLAGARVLVVTDSNHAVDYVEVKNVSTTASSVSETLNDGTASTPSGMTAVTDNNGTIIPWLVTDANGNYNLLFLDGKSQLVSNSTSWYLNNDQVVLDTKAASASIGLQFPENVVANDTTSTTFSAQQLINTVNLGGNPGLGATVGTNFEYGVVSWTVPQGQTAANTVFIMKWTDNHTLVTSVNAPNFTVALYPSAASTQLTAGSNTIITLNGKSASVSDMQPNDVARVAIYGNNKVASNTSIVYIKDTRNTVQGTVTSTSVGNNQTLLTITLADGTTKQIQANGANLTALVPGTPVDLALDSNGQAYWNLYNYGANWSPVIAEVTGTGRDSQSNYTVALNSGGASTTYNVETVQDQTGFNYIVSNSQKGDPFVAVNAINSTVADAVYGATGLYSGLSGATGSAAGNKTGLDDSGKIRFQDTQIAGVTPLAPVYNESATALGAGQTCVADSVQLADNHCSDVYKVYSVSASAGTLTVQELDGITNAPTGNYVSAYTQNGLAVFTQANSAANTVGTYIGLSGLNTGDKVTLWGGGLDTTNKVVFVDQNLANGYYKPGASTFGDGQKPVQVMGLVKQSS